MPDDIHNGLAGQIEYVTCSTSHRKGRVPQYSRNRLQELQAQFDELGEMEVFRCPEDVGVQVEFVNPSFLINKGQRWFRLVTAFADMGRYSKPQPSFLPEVKTTLH